MPSRARLLRSCRALRSPSSSVVGSSLDREKPKAVAIRPSMPEAPRLVINRLGPLPVSPSMSINRAGMLLPTNSWPWMSWVRRWQTPSSEKRSQARRIWPLMPCWRSASRCQGRWRWSTGWAAAKAPGVHTRRRRSR
ncbi:hypothetical protein D3C75_903980 [compost metagenome]